MKKLLSLTAVMATSFALVACTAGEKETAGTIVGAAGGAAVGSMFGSGTGQVLGSVVGAGLGAWGGNTVAKKM